MGMGGKVGMGGVGGWWSGKRLNKLESSRILLLGQISMSLVSVLAYNLDCGT